MSESIVVMMTVADRPWYLQQALASWQKALDHRDDGAMFLFMVEPGSRRSEALQIIDNFPRLPRVIVLNKERHGVLKNPYVGFQNAFEYADHVIAAEEDVIVSEDVLDYFEFVKPMIGTGNILGACANHRFPQATPEETVGKVWRAPWFCPLVWMTDKEIWNNVLEPSWDLDYSSGKPDHSPSGWDWNINLRVIPKQDSSFLFPDASRSDHIGEILGVHTIADKFSDSLAPTFRLDHGVTSWADDFAASPTAAELSP